MDLATARIETIHAALFPPGDARRCSETSASAIYSSSGDLLAEAVPSECGPLGKRGREDRRGGEAHADCQRGRENSWRHWCLHIEGCLSKWAARNKEEGLDLTDFSSSNKRTHSESETCVLFNRNHHRNRNESEFWFRLKQKWIQICTRVLWSK